jgi:hypothetical protein
MKINLLLLCLLLVSFFNFEGNVQDQTTISAEELAKQMANPVADLASVPLQNNFEFGVGPHEGFRYF